MNKTLNQDDAIFKALDLKTIDRVICNTDKGVLTLKIRKGDTQYHLCLDSVPLDAKLNKELMDLLFPKKELEVPQVKKGITLEVNYPSGDPTSTEKPNVKVIAQTKPRGRPKKK